MVQRKPTPEEQLLKLIEGGNASEAGGASAPSGKKPARGPLFNIGRLTGMIDYWKQALRKKSQDGGGTATAVLPFSFTLDIKWANRALAVMVGMALFYLMMDLIFMRPGRRDFLSSVATSDPVFSVLKTGVEDSAKDAAFYQDAARKRNPFLAAGTVESTGAQAPAPEDAAGAPNPLADALASLKLVGISFGEEPLAMVEDVATGRTFFLKKGQEVKGMKVQEIGKEKVVVTYEGQEGELI